jgi:tRNA A-37 threonylcarbamoyl transferase component Bud32
MQMTSVASLTAYLQSGESSSCSVVVLINHKPVELALVQKLRALPGKRAVYKALWDTKIVLVKLFAGDHASRDFEKEKQGIAALINANIPTPALLAEAQLQQTLEPILIIEFLEQAAPFKQCWIGANDDQHADLLKTIVQTIAHHHQSGFYQKDIHLDNFLVKGEAIFTIDGGAIDVTNLGKSLSITTRINNLALFFAQWPPVFDQFIEEALYFYHQATDVYLPLSDVTDKVDACRNIRWKRYQKKIFRQCSEFACEQTPKQFMVCRREYMTPAFASFLSNMNTDLDNLEKPLKIKSGATATVGVLECDGHAFVVKRYNIKSIWHRISRFFRPTRAWHSWRNGYLLRFLGINTPLPVALIEQRIGPFRSVAFLVTEAISALPLNKATAQGVDCVGEVATQIKKLAASKISHGDMKATNLLVKGNEVYLIDLDAMKQHHSEHSFKEALAADMERFMRNWSDQPEVHKAFKVQLKNII